MEKAIEIKRRAQRCIQNGDLDGALSEYGKLVESDDSDPYNFVLLADLLYKKGDTGAATSRYLTAANAYEKAGLYKNGIAVCKKMLRLSLSQSPVLQRLAVLHEMDGLATESSLYYMQYAENMVKEDQLESAAASFRKSFDTSNENVKALERLAEVLGLTGDKVQAAEVLREAAGHYQRAGQLQEADRSRQRALQLSPDGTVAAAPARAPQPAALPVGAGPATLHPSPARSAPATPPAAPGPPAGGPPRLDVESFPTSIGSTRLEPSGPPPLESVENGYPTNGVSAEEHGAPRWNIADSEPAEAEIETPVYEIEVPADSEREAPGLQFESPASAPEPPPSAPAPIAKGARAAAPSAPAAAPAAPPPLGKVEQLLQRAQECFRSGDRESAGASLAEAAREYDSLGQHDSAATIYRSLGKSAQAGAEILMAWLRNCEVRNERQEAGQVACELGERALNDGDQQGAKRWFERARAFDPTNALADRRLQRLAPTTAAAAPPPEPVAEPAPPEPHMEPGRVEVAVGRGEAVTFDLGSLVSEFQRGVEMQLSGDAQGHYDIGMAYREMGLLEQAVEAFQNAALDPGFALRAAEMVGRCLLDQGRFDEASQEFATALAAPGMPPELAADLRYQLALSHEAAGRTREALAEFERVYATQSNYPDVALKIRVLRKTLESQ